MRLEYYYYNIPINYYYFLVDRERVHYTRYSEFINNIITIEFHDRYWRAFVMNVHNSIVVRFSYYTQRTRAQPATFSRRFPCVERNTIIICTECCTNIRVGTSVYFLITLHVIVYMSRGTIRIRFTASVSSFVRVVLVYVKRTFRIAY